jgi:hypothetical protein
VIDVGNNAKVAKRIHFQIFIQYTIQ